MDVCLFKWLQLFIRLQKNDCISKTDTNFLMRFTAYVQKYSKYAWKNIDFYMVKKVFLPLSYAMLKFQLLLTKFKFLLNYDLAL